MIDQERLSAIQSLILKHGAHDAFERGACIMEAVAWLAGEKHSDQPTCACLVIAAFARRLNDRIPNDEMRTRIMRPLVPLLVGTRSASREVMVKRAYIAADFAAREAAPLALEARGHKKTAAKLRAMSPVVDRETAKAAEKELRATYAADAAAATYAADAAATYAADAADADAAAYATYADAAAYATYAADAAAATYATYAADDAAAAAAAYAAYAYAAREPVYRAAAECIRRMCECR